METEELKRKLMGLWERATHNSKELLSVLFDYYFDIKYIEYKESDGKVVGALCGIPFKFGYGNKKLNGLYYIPFSTEEGFRKRGILSELIKKFNDRMKGEFDFTFMVPNTELLADYYGTQGYFSSFFILEERFTPLHDFKNDYFLSLTESDERIYNLKKDLWDKIKVEFKENSDSSNKQIINFIEEIERKGTSSINLCHTPHDLQYIFSEDSIRHLSSYVAYDEDDKITGVAFIQKEELKRIRVIAMYVVDMCSYYSILDFIKRKYPDYSISVNNDDPTYQAHSIIQQTYASSNPAGGDLDNTISTVEIPFNVNKLLQPLGMVKILRFENILQYIAETRSDVDFKLFIRDNNTLEEEDDSSEPSRNKQIFTIKNGKFRIEDYTGDNLPANILNLSRKDVSELLLRKKDSSNLIMEAFGIPRLDLQMRLLPC